jgi:hypothetical protein
MNTKALALSAALLVTLGLVPAEAWAQAAAAPGTGWAFDFTP